MNNFNRLLIVRFIILRYCLRICPEFKRKKTIVFIFWPKRLSLIRDFCVPSFRSHIIVRYHYCYYFTHTYSTFKWFSCIFCNLLFWSCNHYLSALLRCCCCCCNCTVVIEFSAITFGVVIWATLVVFDDDDDDNDINNKDDFTAFIAISM